MIPLRNIVYEKIKGARSITDVELMNMLAKEGFELTRAELNKILLDLEILGLVRVGWISKDKRRIEVRDIEGKGRGKGEVGDEEIAIENDNDDGEEKDDDTTA
ncbi:hypothetical protein HRbin04_00414 [archaeon HR04]|nr:hypothetical protein HRbin04_00414 [archaeon HR04]